MLIPWFGFNWLGITLISLMNLFGLLSLYSFLATVFSDPGAVPKDAKPLTALESVDTKRYCSKCDSFKPLRAYHCKVCNRCVVKMDHHCPWVNNCIGVYNQKLFINFLAWTNVCCIFIFGLVTGLFIDCEIFTNSDGQVENSKFFKIFTDAVTDSCDVLYSHEITVIALLLESIGFFLFTVTMLNSQWSNIRNNQTMVERLKKVRVTKMTDFNEVINYACNVLYELATDKEIDENKSKSFGSPPFRLALFKVHIYIF